MKFRLKESSYIGIDFQDAMDIMIRNRPTDISIEDTYGYGISLKLTNLSHFELKRDYFEIIYQTGNLISFNFGISRSMVKKIGLKQDSVKDSGIINFELKDDRNVFIHLEFV